MKGGKDALLRRKKKHDLRAPHTVSQKSMQLAAFGKLI